MANRALIEKLQGEISRMESGGAPTIGKTEKRVVARDEKNEKDAFKKIVVLFNARDRSEKSTRERLAKEGFGPAEIDEAIDRAKRYGIVDDMRYADILIRSRINQGKGASGIERELEGDGIDVSDVPGWPYEYGIHEESEFQRAFEVLRKNPTRSKNKREGAYRKLVQKGFSSSVASSVARTWADELRN